jgi:hypothetical protein
VSSTFVQPFASYNFGQGWSVTLNTESSDDWTNDKLTVPVNLVVAMIFPRLSGHRVSLLSARPVRE